MEIIQQRLIWLLGTASLLIVLSRMTTRQFAASGVSLSKIKLGLSLLLFGAMAGIVGRLGVIDQALLRSGLVFYLENIIGCLGGWCLIVWGVMESGGGELDSPITASRSRAFAEKLARAVVREQAIGTFWEQMSRYLKMALDCDGVSLHTVKGEGKFELLFENGLGSDIPSSVRDPQQSSLIAEAALHGESVVSSDSGRIHAAGLVATSRGPVESFAAIPFENGTAVLAAYYSRKHRLNSVELEILNIMASALGKYIRLAAADRENKRQLQLRDLQSTLSGIFRANSGLYSPLIISAKLIAKHLPFSEMNLYIGGDGPVQSFDFEIHPGSVLGIKIGHLAKAQYPFLFSTPGEGESCDTARVRAIPSRGSLLATGNSAIGKRFWIETGFSDSRPAGQAPADILCALCDLIALRLGREDAIEQNSRFTQLLGAVRHLQERALTGENIDEILQETAQVVVESGIFQFCRLTICDSRKSELKTAALARLWPAGLQSQLQPSIPLERTPLHKRALVAKTTVAFGQEKPGLIMSHDEACLLLTEGIKRGMIVPIILKDKAMGALIAGDFRGSQRPGSDDLAELFLGNIAGLLSLILMRHKVKSLAGGGREGQKKLKVVKAEVKSGLAEPRLAVGVRSRINGPLAGILASCEYLKDSCPDIDRHVGRYLEVIEKNAERIHEITQGTAEK
ncbi:MAG: hypothetical protein A2W25_02925 [candidate division Zixibacteria bacterium RBG_16_53_22]|nr:MAG: hypothetical protein A2W25_02925 [candidate division Zixibacteria bacterium RBG_16_53_22]